MGFNPGTEQILTMPTRHMLFAGGGQPLNFGWVIRGAKAKPQFSRLGKGGIRATTRATAPTTSSIDLGSSYATTPAAEDRRLALRVLG